jgi:hypothetical protein
MYLLLTADFRALLYFFREFSMHFFKYGNPYKHCIIYSSPVVSLCDQASHVAR